MRDSLLLSSMLDYGSHSSCPPALIVCVSGSTVNLFDNIANAMLVGVAPDEGDSDGLSFAGFEKLMEQVALHWCSQRQKQQQKTTQSMDFLQSPLSQMMNHINRELHDKPRSEADPVITRILEPSVLRCFARYFIFSLEFALHLQYFLFLERKGFFSFGPCDQMFEVFFAFLVHIHPTRPATKYVCEEYSHD